MVHIPLMKDKYRYFKYSIRNFEWKFYHLDSIGEHDCIELDYISKTPTIENIPFEISNGIFEVSTMLC